MNFRGLGWGGGGCLILLRVLGGVWCLWVVGFFQLVRYQ